MSLAVVCMELTADGAVEVREWAAPTLGPTAVAVEVRAASINVADVLMVRGLYQARPEPPFVVGTECAGVVTEIGPEVTDLAVGDRVLALVGVGAFATRAVVTPRFQQVHRIPDGMPWDEAAAFNLTFGAAYHGLLRRGGLRAGETVLVLGAGGGCGSAAVQVAQAAGASVIAVAGGEEKCALARRLGADTVLDHHAVTSLSAAVEERTGGHGVDVVFDPVGGLDAREQLRCLAWGGRYLVVGFASGQIPVVPVNRTVLKGVSVVGVAYGTSAMIDPAANEEDFRQLFAWYGEGLVRPAVGHRFALAAAEAALRVVSDRQAVGKVVIEMPR